MLKAPYSASQTRLMLDKESEWTGKKMQDGHERRLTQKVVKGATGYQ